MCGEIVITLEKDLNIMYKNSFKVKVENINNVIGLGGLLVDEYLLETMEVDSLESCHKIPGKKGKNPVLSNLIKI